MRFRQAGWGLGQERMSPVGRCVLMVAVDPSALKLIISLSSLGPPAVSEPTCHHSRLKDSDVLTSHDERAGQERPDQGH